MESIRDLGALLRSLEPSVVEGEYVFCLVGKDEMVPRGVDPVGTFREEEGLTLILERTTADREAMAYGSIFAMISLRVRSSLLAVGLTAAVARALAEKGIPANIVAAYHHDHLFVPHESARAALEVLQRLQEES